MRLPSKQSESMRKAVVFNGIRSNGKVYEIEGQRFVGAEDVHRIAVIRGSTHCLSTTCDRLKKGVRTWAGLIEKSAHHFTTSGKSGGAARAAKLKKEKEECAAALAAIDARKRELGL